MRKVGARLPDGKSVVYVVEDDTMNQQQVGELVREAHPNATVILVQVK